MLSLQKASHIYSEFQNIIETGDSSYLSDAIVHSSDKICELMNNLNADSVLYLKNYLSVENFIKSISVDNIEVIGYKKDNNRCRYENFYVNIDKICEMANPALFGKGNETIYDENVRKAFDISANRIRLRETEPQENKFNYFFKNIIPINKKFKYELYKMHIYKEGGKFSRHKDTIHAPNHYATLVISIPTEFTGGELLLYENKGDENPLTTCNLKHSNSVIFLTDVEHEVLEVKSGTRIVLQYDVYLEDKISDEYEYEDEYEDEYEEDDNNECPYNKDNKTYLSSKKYIENLNTNIDTILLEEVEKFMLSHHIDDEICFLLSRQYPLSITEKYLKAGDKKLYDILSSKYLIEIGYAVNHYGSDCDGLYSKIDKEKLKVMNYTNIKKFLQQFKYDEKLDGNKNKSKIKTHIFVAGGKFKATKCSEYIEHTGNEASPAEYTYVSVTLCCKRKI